MIAHIQHTNSISVLDTQFCLVIATQKIGTQFLGKFFNKSGGTTQFSIESTEDGKWKITNTSYYNREVDRKENTKKSEELSLLSFLNDDNFNKDVIILIRNPWDRFMSAWYEDYFKPFIRSSNPSIPYLAGLAILQNTDDNVYDDSTAVRKNCELETLVNFWKERAPDMISKYKNSNEHIEDNTSTLFYYCLEIICHHILKSYLKSNYFLYQGHNHPYHLLLSNILITNNNLRKVKIFDIDNVDLNVILNKYIAGSNREGSYTNSSKESKNRYLKNVLETKEGLKERVIRGLSLEILAYESIKRKAQIENK